MRVRFPLRRRKRLDPSPEPTGWVGLAPMPVTVRMRPPVMLERPDVVGVRPILRRGAVLGLPVPLVLASTRESSAALPEIAASRPVRRVVAVPRTAAVEPTSSWTDDDSISELRAI